jgi:hypothetical protein
VCKGVGKVSFLSTSQLEEFMYQLVDMNGDGAITNSDFELFLGTMPNELELILDHCTKEEKVITSRDCLLRMKLKKYIKPTHKVIHIRGNNYETISHQLPFIAKTIMSAFSREGNNEITSKDVFRGWLIANSEFLEYWFDIVCPLGWISQATIERACFRKSSGERIVLKLQKTIQYLYGKNEKLFAYYLLQSELPEEIGLRTSKKSSYFKLLCCDCMKSSKVSPETYLFERDWIKKSDLICIKDQKQRKCTLVYKYNSLYILLTGNRVYGNSTNKLIEVIMLKGCYMQPVASLLLKRVLHFGFKIILGENEAQSEINFYSASLSEINEWIACLTALLKYWLV